MADQLTNKEINKLAIQCLKEMEAKYGKTEHKLKIIPNKPIRPRLKPIVDKKYFFIKPKKNTVH